MEDITKLNKIIDLFLNYAGMQIPIGKDDIIYTGGNYLQLESNGEAYDVFLNGYSHIKKIKDTKKRKQLEKAGQDYTVLNWCEVEPNSAITIPGIKITGNKKLEDYILKEDGQNPYFTGVKYLSFLTLLTDWQMEPCSVFKSGSSLKKDYLKYNDKQYVGVEALVLDKDDSKYGELKPAFSKAFEMELRENEDFCLDLLTPEGFVRIALDYALLDYALKKEIDIGLDKNIAPNVGYNIYNRMLHDENINQEKLAEFIGAIDDKFKSNPAFIIANMMYGMLKSIQNCPGIKQGLNYFANKRKEKTNNY